MMDILWIHIKINYKILIENMILEINFYLRVEKKLKKLIKMNIENIIIK